MAKKNLSLDLDEYYLTKGRKKRKEGGRTNWKMVNVNRFDPRHVLAYKSFFLFFFFFYYPKNASPRFERGCMYVRVCCVSVSVCVCVCNNY